MSGIFIFDASKALDATLDHMNKVTADWTLRAARGECSWVCADCCVTFPEGMPDACAHGIESCTSIIKRDKAEAAAARPIPSQGT